MRSEAPWPKLVVFDLDYTLWPVSIYELIGKLWVDTHVDPPLQRRAGALNEVVDRCVRPLTPDRDSPCPCTPTYRTILA